MANFKSIVDIDVNDAQFRRFSELFEKYRQQLQKMPGAWASIGKEHRAIAASMMAQNQLVREQTKLEQKQLSTLERAESLWKGMSSASGNVLRNVLGIGRTVLKWGSILGGGLLGGSLWGLNRLAEGVATTRYNSMGLGMSYGGYRSFGINMSRFVDPGSFLASINQAMSNPALASPLYALGVNPNGSTEDVSIAMLKAMRRLAISTPRNVLGSMSQAYGLEPFGGLETLMRLRKVSAEEFYKQLTAERKDKGGLGLPPGVQRAWTDFTTQMHLAGATIETTLVKRLAPLAGPLTRLSGSIVDLINRIAKNHSIEDGIDTIAKWIDSFNGKISKPEFLKSIDQLVSDTKIIAGAVHTFARVVRDIGSPGKLITDIGGQSPRSSGESFGEYFRNLFAFPSDYRRYLAGLDKKYRLPSGTLERTWQVESGGDFNAVNSRTGAAGPFQFMPKTAAMYGIDPFNPGKAAEAAGKYLSALRARFGSMTAALAAYNWGPQNVQKDIAQHGKNWFSYAPKETRDYVIRIENATGASAVVAVNGLSQ